MPTPLSAPAPGPDRFRWVLVLTLRGGVLFAGGLLLAGLALYLARGAPLPLETRPTAGGVAEGLAAIGASGDPLSLISFGLFVLIGLPVARVALSLFHFARERDLLYVGITLTVLGVLFVGVLFGEAL